MTAEIITVTSATPIADTDRQKLIQKLEAKFGQNPVEFAIDSELMAGIVIHFQNNEYRFDLKSEVDYILNELLK